MNIQPQLDLYIILPRLREHHGRLVGSMPEARVGGGGMNRILSSECDLAYSLGLTAVEILARPM